MHDALNDVTEALYREGKYQDAAMLGRAALTHAKGVFGEAHPETLRSVNNLAMLYQTQGRYGDAEPLVRRALTASERVLGETHPDTLDTRLNQIALLVNQQRLDPALRALRTLDQRLRALVIQELDSTEQEAVKLQRLAAESRLQHVVFTLALAHPDSADAGRLAADVLLRWKRLAADEEAVIARLARTSQDPRALALAQQASSTPWRRRT
ncbi:tetratricopeptide repeat protein [Thiohalocapsa sp. ML1]|uniref:tetratricopeptide repeat protein n=1 Tax=Thiohalocapsa sp. ML1 TaxID=1431688 RepID=UPI0007323866|nr:tetratricopeptide repeat protein [Thiohalocapsa sp. ML1]